MRRKGIFDFLKSRDARLPCPLCGHERWNGWDERVLLTRATHEAGDLDAFEAIPLTCANCGFIRFQSAHVPMTPAAKPADMRRPTVNDVRFCALIQGAGVPPS